MLKALAREPEQRYPSAERLLEDVRAFRESRPVSARPATRPYRLARFVRGNRGPVAALSSLVAVLAVSLAAMTIQRGTIRTERDRARLEAARATQVSDFLEGLFRASDPYQGAGMSMPVGDILAQGRRDLDDLDGQPEVRATMLEVLGRVYLSLGDYDEAGALYTRALDTRRSVFGDEHMDVARSLSALGGALGSGGALDSAQVLLDRALEIALRIGGAGTLEYARMLMPTGTLRHRQADYEQAVRRYGEALTIYQRLLPYPDLQLAQAQGNPGLAYDGMRRMDEALSFKHAAVATFQALPGDQSANLAQAYDNLAVTLERTGELDEAEAMLRRSLDAKRVALPGGHPSIGVSMTNLGNVLVRLARYDEAERLFADALELERAAVGPEHRYAIHALDGLADVAGRRGDAAAAESRWREALGLTRRGLGREHPRAASILLELGRLRRTQGDLADAERLLRESVRIREAGLGVDARPPSHALRSHPSSSIGAASTRPRPCSLMFCACSTRPWPAMTRARRLLPSVRGSGMRAPIRIRRRRWCVLRVGSHPDANEGNHAARCTSHPHAWRARTLLPGGVFMKRTLLSIALAVGALPLPVQGQRIEGRVNWLGWGEHPDATVQLLDVRLELVESIPVGADGTFVVSVAAGTWHLQAFAGGASSPLTEPIGLNGPQDTVQVVLSIATPLFFQGSQCPAGAPDANGVVVGVVYDDRSSLVLPGALVHLRWDAAPGEAGDAVAETGRHGTYRFCGVPTDRPVELAVQYVDRRAQAAAPLRLEPGVVHREDLRVSLEASTGPIILSAVDATEGSRLDGPLSVIEGRVLDAAADGPLPGARIAISGTDRIATTDAEGRFRLDDVAAGDIVLRVSGPVGNRDVPVRIPRGRVLDVDVWIRAALQQPRHFEAERRRLDQTRFRAANGRDVTGLVVAGEAMADYERAGAELVTILRERFPLRVSYRGSGGVCVEDPRDVLVPDAPVPSSEAVRTPCATILVLLDDDIYRRAVGMPPLPIFLLSLHAQDLESVAFVSRDQLHVVPGLKNAIPRSALILHLRGKGPFVDPLRNRTNERAVESM